MITIEVEENTHYTATDDNRYELSYIDYLKGFGVWSSIHYMTKGKAEQLTKELLEVINRYSIKS